MTVLEIKPVPAWTWNAAVIVVPPRRASVRASAFDEEMIVFEPEGGNTFYMNKVASFVWERCDGVKSMREIAIALMDRYEIPYDRALDDVEQVVAWLANSHLLDTPEMK